MKFPQPFLHSRTFKLERGYGISPSKQPECSLVIQRHGIYVDIYSSVFLYVCQGFLEDGQGPQPQEVHLEHSHIFYPGSFIL